MKLPTVQHIRQRSVLPGRQRWDIPAIRKSATLAENIKHNLISVDGIQNTSTNTLTGRILVEFDDEKLNSEEVKNFVQKAVKYEPVSFSLHLSDQQQINQSEQGSKRGTIAKGLDELTGMVKSFRDNEVFQLVKNNEKSEKLRHKAMALSAGHSVLKLATPMTISLMISSVLFPIKTLSKIGLSKAAQLGLFGTLFGVSRVAESSIQHKKRVAWSEYANNVEQNLSVLTVSHIQYLELAYLDSQNTEKLMAVVNTDTDSIKRFVDYVPDAMIDKATTLTIGTAVICFISPAALFLSLLPVPLLTKVNQKQQLAIAPRHQEMAKLNDEYNQLLSNNLNGLSTVKSFIAEEHEIERLKHAKALSTENNIDLDKTSSYYGSLTEFTFVLGAMGPIVTGCIQVLKGNMGMTSYMIQNGIGPALLNGATGLEYSRALYSNATMSASRINKLLEQKVEKHASVPSDNTAFEGQLLFDQIQFSYGDTKILNSISLEIPARGKVAFVGPTGSGKSTLMKLLMRFYGINEGEIRLDGKGIQDLRLADLRSAISLVSQDPYLFNGTILENIAFGKPDATFEQIVEASKVAQAYDFIMASGNGFQTQIGERGRLLSGGQRQRISIARAVLKQSKILIMDEATSAVDNETEAAIRRAVETISENTTVLIIAHRLSTIRYVDTIYHLKNGEITEKGSHEELLSQNGDYATLWRLQTAEVTDINDAETAHVA